MTDRVDLLALAATLVRQTRHGSPSMLMRRIGQDHGIRITFETARGLLAQLHEAGVVGPDRGSLGHVVLPTAA
ncbi:hypothetical protein ACIGFK_13235 [Streptomyces sp. NPDC085524]|uniref:hypothetical protein n=1 Tax=Streptomyces sp. NPDC085524 TaxID=3365728 RepID=UPI0037D29A3F